MGDYLRRAYDEAERVASRGNSDATRARQKEQDLQLISAVLETMAEDLAEVVEQYGLGACMVLAFAQGERIQVVAKAHKKSFDGMMAPSELISIRKNVRCSS